ncbi:MAG: HipA domain-containing protein [Acidimicrobiaceae bacterium]|nr:HipA domain-containing protein [Acidimicrobiaceae bacterium]
MDALAVWLNGVKIAVVDQKRGRLSLAYTTDALDKYPLGSPLLSFSLALKRERYGHGVVRPFLDGLLPEGEARQAVAREFGVDRDDTYGLIRELGRDCAGALVIQHLDDPPPLPSTTFTAERLNDDEIAALVANLRSAPLGAGGRVRISLAGVQEKLLLTRMPDGAWGRPVNGTPSTHILKPEIPRFPNTVENEVFCMRVAKHLGLAVANVETTTIGGRKIIVVARYDRVVHSDGSVDRIHQEDFCQAFGVSPDKKYEEDGGPSLDRIAGILQTAAGPDSVETLLRAVTLNVLIGNGDAHAKNFSLLHHPSGALRLTPLYDLLSTLFYGDEQLAMYIDNVRRTNLVTADRIVNEARRWGMSKRRASEVITEILERVVDAVAVAAAETVGLPAEIPALVASQLAQLRSEFKI